MCVNCFSIADNKIYYNLNIVVWQLSMHIGPKTYQDSESERYYGCMHAIEYVSEIASIRKFLTINRYIGLSNRSTTRPHIKLMFSICCEN